MRIRQCKWEERFYGFVIYFKKDKQNRCSAEADVGTSSGRVANLDRVLGVSGKLVAFLQGASQTSGRLGGLGGLGGVGHRAVVPGEGEATLPAGCVAHLD